MGRDGVPEAAVRRKSLWKRPQQVCTCGGGTPLIYNLCQSTQECLWHKGTILMVKAVGRGGSTQGPWGTECDRSVLVDKWKEQDATPMLLATCKQRRSSTHWAGLGALPAGSLMQTLDERASFCRPVARDEQGNLQAGPPSE